jgi:5-methyltetrahydropteroyltriglutamate--homocysteine methyltransferase
MKRSEQRILTTHTGALHRPPDLAEMLARKFQGQPYDEPALSERLVSATAEVVRAQEAVGVDVVNDGEFSKSSWYSYATERMSGFEFGDNQAALSRVFNSKDATAFADFYRDAAANNGMLHYVSDSSTALAARSMRAVCTGPISYTGDAIVAADIANLTAAMQGVDVEEGFLAVAAPGSIQPAIPNEYYPDDESYLVALAEALHEEYRAITDAGLLVQIDDAFMPFHYDMRADWDVPEFRAWANTSIEALNFALRGIAPERVRYHICWGSWNGPHTADIPLSEIVDLLLKVNAGAYSIEAANPRHVWEWCVWRDVPLPPGKILIPGVVEHCTNVVEHPQTVAQRIIRYAEVVGRENVIAGTDCGYYGRIHPQIAWAKQQAITDGAALATRALWP